MRHQLLGWRPLHDLPGVEHHDFIGQVAGAGQIVRDVEVGEARLVAQTRHQIEDPHPDGDVEHADRFVGQDDRGLDGQGAREGDALALTAGELVR